MANLPPAETPDISPDDLGIDAVAARLGKSVGWLNWRLSLDRGEAEPKLQHHHYIGRTPRWDEDEYQRLRQALTTRTPPKGGRQRKPAAEPDSAHPVLPSSSATDIGISTELLAFEDAHAACDAVLAYRPGQSSKTPRSKSSAKSKTTLSTRSSTGSSPRRRLGLRLVNTSTRRGRRQDRRPGRTDLARRPQDLATGDPRVWGAPGQHHRRRRVAGMGAARKFRQFTQYPGALCIRRSKPFCVGARCRLGAG